MATDNVLKNTESTGPNKYSVMSAHTIYVCSPPVFLFQPTYNNVSPLRAFSSSARPEEHNDAHHTQEGVQQPGMSECEPSRCGDVHCGDLSKYPVLQDSLPPGYDYHVVAFEERSSETDHSAFCATLRLPLKTEQETTQWILETRDTPAHITWRVFKFRPAKCKRNLYRKDYVCQYNVNYKSSTGRTKNTNCPAKLTVIIKADPRREGKGKWAKVDLHLPQYPTVIILKNIHNHVVRSAAALKHRDDDDGGSETQEESIRLSETGHSAADGPSAIPNDLQAMNMQPDGDRSVLIGRMRGVLTSIENVMNDPATSNEQLAAMTERLQDIVRNPFKWPRLRPKRAREFRQAAIRSGPTMPVQVPRQIESGSGRRLCAGRSWKVGSQAQSSASEQVGKKARMASTLADSVDRNCSHPSEQTQKS